MFENKAHLNTTYNYIVLWLFVVLKAKKKKNPRGNKVSKEKQEKKRIEIMELMMLGKGDKQIMEQLKLPSNTLYRYKRDLYKDYHANLQERQEQIISAMTMRCEERIMMCRKYINDPEITQSSKKDWLSEEKTQEKHYLETLQSVGLMKKSADAVDVNVTSKTDEKLEELNAVLSKARDSISKEEKNSPSSK